jgi:hypothetical protein
MTPNDCSRNRALLRAVRSARPEDHDAAELTALKYWLVAYQERFGNQVNPPLPDDTTAAQLLTLAPFPKLICLFEMLAAERRKPGPTYDWYITAALHRIHGIPKRPLESIEQQLRLWRNRTWKSNASAPN